VGSKRVLFYFHSNNDLKFKKRGRDRIDDAEYVSEDLLKFTLLFDRNVRSFKPV
jgi:hypothetical protein